MSIETLTTRFINITDNGKAIHCENEDDAQIDALFYDGVCQSVDLEKGTFVQYENGKITGRYDLTNDEVRNLRNKITLRIL